MSNDDQNPRWLERHSVNCYFCGLLFDEREGVPANPFNGNDGGDCCPDCVPKPDKECPNCHNGTIGSENGQLVCRGECGNDFGPDKDEAADHQSEIDAGQIPPEDF